ncbi:hypothetical protein CDAR_555881 [Caerostris darwini]|uniref:Uncharacterized protein n=1 Tax=Caerostris darwini TaxID=1538125 RepID=A0AAV4NBQ8_9ARAC|nr:hypothetical protein CDAR_555881 [Caerostris darwini]
MAVSALFAHSPNPQPITYQERSSRDRSSANFLPKRLWTHSSKAFSEEKHMDRILRTGSACQLSLLIPNRNQSPTREVGEIDLLPISCPSDYGPLPLKHSLRRDTWIEFSELAVRLNGTISPAITVAVRSDIILGRKRLMCY